MLSKSELIKRCRHYFDNKNVNVMYATEDGHFFHEGGQHFAQSYARSNNFSEVIKITRADLKEKPEEIKPQEDKPEVNQETESPKDNDETNLDNDKTESSENGLDLEALKAEGKKLKIKGFAVMKAETLKRKIEEANGAA